MNRLFIIALALLPLACEAAEPTWTHAADEDQSFTLYKPAKVRYGAGATWDYYDSSAGAVTCSNAYFGKDPLNGTRKACDVDSAAALLKSTDVPACFPDVQLKPKVKTISVSEADFPGHTKLSVWTCKTPTGYASNWMVWSKSEVVDWFLLAVTGMFDQDEAKEACKRECKALTTAELEKGNALSKQYFAYARVTSSGTAATRPVYALVNGVRNTKAAAGASVKVGAECNIEKRLGETGYYSVEGQPNEAAAGKLGDVYAICTFVAPTGINGK